MFSATNISHGSISGVKSGNNDHQSRAALPVVVVPAPGHHAAPAPALITTRPTLILGVGGTGHRIVLNVKHAYGGSVPEWVSLLVLDSAHEDLRLRRNGFEVRMEPGNELVYIGDVSVAAIMRNLKHLAILNETFGERLRNLPRITYRDGVAGNRTAGQLSFHYHASEIERALSSRLRTLSRYEGAASDELVQSIGLNVLICGSVCGGQGSGAMLDLSYLVRELMTELGQLADNSLITGVFLLPDAFPGLQNRYLEPNTVEFLQLVEHLMAEGGFVTHFPNLREVDSVEAPFDRVFLFGGIDQNGRTHSSHAEITAVVGQMLHLLHATPAGQKLENDFFNFSGVLSQRTRAGELACFGSLGLAVLSADGAKLQRQCARLYAIDVNFRALLSQPNQSVITQMAVDFIGQSKLEASTLRRALMIDSEGGAILVDATLPGQITRRQPEEISAVAANYIRDYRQMRLIRQVAPQIDANAGQLLETAQTAMNASIIESVERHGVRHAVSLAMAFYRGLVPQLRTWQQDLAERKQAVEEAEVALTQSLDALSRAGGQIFFMRRRAVEEALARCERAAQTYAESFLEHRIAEGAVVVLSKLEREARASRQRFDGVIQRLEQAGQMLRHDSSLDDLSDTEHVPADIDLIDDALVAHWYATSAPKPKAGLIDVLSHAKSVGAPVQTWDKLTAQQLAELLIEGLYGSFAHLAALGVEEIVAALQEEISPERWQNRLLEMAVPMCNLESVRLVDGDVQPATVAVLGVPDDTKTLFDQHPEMLVSTGDRKRLVALVATLGLPLSALKQWPAWEKAYERANRN